MKALFQAIYTYYGAHVTTGALAGQLFVNEAPQDTSFPFVVYRLLSITPDPNFAGEVQEEATIEFALYDNSISCSNITDYYATIIGQLDNAKITVTGYTSLIFERDYASLDFDIETDIWTYTIQYRVLLLKS